MSDTEAIDLRLNEDAPAQSRLDFYAGAYEMARLLLTSPRFNKSQREILEEQGEICKERLETRGVSFAETENSHE
jgi:hypothetical protein